MPVHFLGQSLRHGELAPLWAAPTPDLGVGAGSVSTPHAPSDGPHAMVRLLARVIGLARPGPGTWRPGRARPGDQAAPARGRAGGEPRRSATAAAGRAQGEAGKA